MGSAAFPVTETGKIAAAVVVPQRLSQSGGLRIDRRGVWTYDGEPFARKDMVCLLASRLRRAADGGYELQLPCDTAPVPVEVEDAPFLAVEVFRSGRGRDQVLSFRTNMDCIVTLDADHPLIVSEDPETGEPVPYIMVSEGMSARLSRPAYYEVAALAEERLQDGKEQVGLWSSRQFFVLGPVA